LTALARGALRVAAALIVLALSAVKPPSWSGWQPIPSIPTKIMVTRSGLQVRVTMADDQCWDAPLPCTPYFNPGLRSRADGPGEDFHAGFSSTAEK
jgi:hypothetical protein